MGKMKSGKREIDRARRHAKIEKENRYILERLSKAMSKKTIDNEESDMCKYSVSRAQEQRRVELQRITEENQRLLHRIQNTEPSYNRNRWEEEAKRHDRILDTMCEFPPSKRRDRERQSKKKMIRERLRKQQEESQTAFTFHV